jgi:hypothetical protein
LGDGLGCFKVSKLEVIERLDIVVEVVDGGWWLVVGGWWLVVEGRLGGWPEIVNLGCRR